MFKLKTTAEQIVIMQCAINGDKIEARSMCSEYWSPWIGHPIWDWLHNDYRVKKLEQPEGLQMVVMYRMPGKVILKQMVCDAVPRVGEIIYLGKGEYEVLNVYYEYDTGRGKHMPCLVLKEG